MDWKESALDLQELVRSFGSEPTYLSQALGLVGIAVLAWIANAIASRVMLQAVHRFADSSANRWDDALVRARFFQRLANLVPPLVVYFGVHALGLQDAVVLSLQRIALAVATILFAVVVSAALNAVNEIYSQVADASHRPIKGYLGFVRLALYSVSVIIALSILMDRSPWIFLSGLGAVSAVLLIIFKDTLLSLVASIQITSNHLVQVGDWVEMSDYQADGDVIDIALHTVKIQNWDKTITTVPTYAFITAPFKNWRGMSESNSRRIKRALFVDVTSIRFLENADIERFASFALLREYFARKQRELTAHNSEPGRDPAKNADIRRLTNIGTFRAYMLEYLRNHPKIHRDRTLIVRQLSPSADGLPLEIYCFTNDIVWANHEGIQSDIFDHFFAIAPEFGIRIFQRPSGADLSSLRTSQASV